MGLTGEAAPQCCVVNGPSNAHAQQSSKAISPALTVAEALVPIL